MASLEKKTYVATVGLNFDGLKDKPRVEAGELIPATVPEAEIKQLLADGAIADGGDIKDDG